MKYVYLTLIFSFLLGKNLSFSQKRFPCNASYMVVGNPTNNGNTNIGCRIFQVSIDPSNGTLLPALVAQVPNVRLNGVGYRRQDGLIYGVKYGGAANPGNAISIYNVDANGVATELTQLKLSTAHQYYSGDVSPDGRYYTLIGNGSNPNIMYQIDLTDPGYGFTSYNLVNTTGTFESPDVTYSLDGNVLFVFDANTKTLMEIDPAKGLITKKYAANTTLQGNPSLSGAWKQNCLLFGYGAAGTGGSSFFSIDYTGKFTGIAGKMTKLNTSTAFGTTSSFDGCSCYEPLKYFMNIEEPRADTCISDYLVNLVVENTCGVDQKNSKITLPFPSKDFEIKKITRQPYGGDIKSGVGTNSLVIENMKIPGTRDSITLVVRLNPNTSTTAVYTFQSLLENLSYAKGENFSLLSDNEFTIEEKDSANIIAPVFFKKNLDSVALCPDGFVTLKPGFKGVADNYRWNTGLNAPSLQVTKPGNYAVTATTACNIVIDSFIVRPPQLSVDLGGNKTIAPNDTLFLGPNIVKYNPVVKYEWFVRGATDNGAKATKTNVIRPTEDEAQVGLRIQDKQGCIAYDEMIIYVRRKEFVPNIFSPNLDGQNDDLRVFSEYPTKIVLWQIFDRWGTIVFEAKDCNTYDFACSWDGNIGAKKAAIGMYTSVLTLENGKNRVKKIVSEVTLLR